MELFVIRGLPDPWESNYAEAELGCNLTYGGNLMRIGNALANSIACDLADKKRASVGTDIYVGARRINNVWSLPDGLPLPYINWYPGQPENTSGYDCVMLNLYHTSWYATTCDQYARNICTFPIKK
ncbi:unnamed protein product, partial [Mesorhabditis belari]|uniref:C-type lectin domain-containing protein n=1 Tax=Mesorhabditis belari TaxID=2138241 RepID=A0AAF3ESJ0_9BILA